MSSLVESPTIFGNACGAFFETVLMKGDDIARRLLDFAAGVHELLKQLPKERAARHISDQLWRSATSGGSNYGEARSAESRRDFAHKVGLAAKEVREAGYWLGLIECARLAPETSTRPLINESNELVAILISSAKTARRAAG